MSRSVDVSCERPGPQSALGVESDEVVELQKIGHGMRRKEIIRLPGEIGSKNKMKDYKK